MCRQMFTLKHVNEQYLHDSKELFVLFIFLEKAYDRVGREAVWQKL